MKTFVTFLGKGRENPETGYRKTTYKFPDSSHETTAFFGLALAKYINPNRLVILGANNRAGQNVLREVDPSKRKICENLNQIRNALAHGSSSNTESVQKMFMDEQKLHRALKKAFDCLLSN